MQNLGYRTNSILADRNEILVTNKDSNGIALLRLRYPKLESETIKLFSGLKSACLARFQDLHLISIDNTLCASRDLMEWKTVLSLKPGNFIWHICETQKELIAQEYGEPPTYLYRSQNGLEWEKILDNNQVDRTSKHWHSVAYDKNQDHIYATLGDGNITKVITLKNNFSWKPLYTGPWQFVPIVVLDDKAVFGMDSNLVHGGMGIYRRDAGWEFTFLRWNDENIKRGQVCDLKLLSNGIWVAALGSPSAVLVSKDLRRWVVAEISEINHDFNHFMNISEGDGFVAVSTSKGLILFEKDEISNLALREPFVAPYKAYKERLMGPLNMTKRRAGL